MKYLVTGASGFLGSNLVKNLVRSGNKIVGLTRKTSNLRRLEGIITDIELRSASLHDYPQLLEALDGIDCVYHLAANVRIGSFKKKEIRRDNVAGCQNLFNAAIEKKISKVVYVSSISIFGSDIEEMLRETDVAAGRIMSTYGETKLVSYYSFKNAYNRGLDITAVIPSNIFGPDDPNFGPLFKNYVQKHLKVIAGNLDANMGMVYVDDVSKGMMLAMAKGKPGESYILNSTNITLKELLAYAEQYTNIKTPGIKIPKHVIKGAALFAEIAGRIIRQNMILNRQSAELLFTTHPGFDSSKAKKELGWKPKPFDDAFRTTLNWYLDKYGKKKVLAK
jgi:nucleoside-diphosphate-sugar epimerase